MIRMLHKIYGNTVVECMLSHFLWYCRELSEEEVISYVKRKLKKQKVKSDEEKKP